MALAGHDHIFVAVEPALRRASGDMGGECSEASPLRRLALLAAEGAAHAAALAHHFGIGDAQHLGDNVLHFGWVLGRAVNGHTAMLLGHRHAHLAFEIEMLLAADEEGFLDPTRRGFERLRDIAALEFIGRQHVLGFHCHRIVGRNGRRLDGDLDLTESGRAPCLIARFCHDGEDYLAVKLDRATGEDGIVAERWAAIVDAGTCRSVAHAGRMAVRTAMTPG